MVLFRMFCVSKKVLPDFANCPRESSIKNRGRAPKTNINVYGMRKTPSKMFNICLKKMVGPIY